ncbi:MAG: response regulator [bacterium]
MDPTTKIVIFEDEYLLANDLKRQLCRFGYEVTAMFRKAEDGIEFLASNKDPAQFPEVALMDITLAGKMTGIDAAVIIAEKYPCALVFITGMSQFEYVEEAFRTKPFAFLLKPFEVSQAVVSIKLAVYQKDLESKLLKYQKELEEKVEERNREITITRKTAEEAIRTKQAFLNQVSGQILDPIYGIMGLSAMMKEEIKDKPGLMRYTEYLEDNSRHLFSLLNSILDLREDDIH